MFLKTQENEVLAKPNPDFTVYIWEMVDDKLL